MPLPYAPPPKDSKVYRDLKNIKVTSVTSTQMDTLKGELFAQGVNGSEDEMRRLKLLGEVSNMQSQSGPIPNTQIVKRIVDTTGSGNPTGTIYAPENGTVWELSTLDWETKNATSMNFWIEDADGNKSRLDYQSSTGSTIYSGVVKITYPCKISYNISSATGDNTFTASLIRVR